jgi:hypothetical protein
MTTTTIGVTGTKTNDDVTVGVAVIVTYTMSEIVVKAPTTAVGIALPDLLGLPMGAQVLDTMTTLDEILPRHRSHPMTTALSGRTCPLRMAILGVSKKTCTEGMVGLTEVATILKSKWLAACIAGQTSQSSRRRQQRVNNTFSIWPPSPRAPARDLCAFSSYLALVIFNPSFVGHRSDTNNHARSISGNVPHLSHPRQRIVRRTGGVVNEKKEN